MDSQSFLHHGMDLNLRKRSSKNGLCYMLGSITVHYLLLQNIATYLFTELANNGRHRQIPFKAIAEWTLSFIGPEYLPVQFKFLDPQNMHKSTIQDFFNHILQCQLGQGPKRAFWFKAIKARDGTLSSTQYPDELSIPTPS